MQAGEQLVRVNQDTRLNFRVLDMRTPANQGIFRVQCQIENVSIIELYFADDFIYVTSICGQGFMGRAVYFSDHPRCDPRSVARS